MGKGARACRMPGSFGTHKKFAVKKDQQLKKHGDKAKKAKLSKGIQVAKVTTSSNAKK